MAGLVTSDTRLGTYYFPTAQAESRTMTLAVRTAGEPTPLTASHARALSAIDPELPLYGVQHACRRASTRASSTARRR